MADYITRTRSDTAATSKTNARVVVEGVRAPSPSGERAVRHSAKFPNEHVAAVKGG